MTPEERAAAIVIGISVALRDERIEKSLQYLIASAIREAVKDRDMEWWQALACVDNVAPTPEAVRAWVLALSKHFEEEAVDKAVAAEREALLNASESRSWHDELCDVIISDRGARIVKWDKEQTAYLYKRLGKKPE